MLTSFRFDVSQLAVKFVVGAGLLAMAGAASAQMPGPGPGPGPVAPPVKVNTPPVLESFSIRGVIGDFYVAEGTVSDDDPTKCIVYFSGAMAGYCTHVRADGSFSISVDLGPGEGGAVDAQAQDDAGQYSNVLSTVVITE